VAKGYAIPTRMQFSLAHERFSRQSPKSGRHPIAE
jgi:hypothetical protein